MNLDHYQRQTMVNLEVLKLHQLIQFHSYLVKFFLLLDFLLLFVHFQLIVLLP